MKLICINQKKEGLMQIDEQITYSCETHHNPYFGMDLRSTLKTPKIDKA